MNGLIEPNWHPIVVHFVIAFLLTSPALLLAAALAPASARWRPSVQAAGDWMIALGAVAAVFAVATGLQAYYSVAHDGPSHAAMTDHRNFAFATVALLGGFAFWRFAARSSAPSKSFSVLFLAATLLLATTAWKGGRLVYRYGLGVESLPASTGEGHDHEHAPGEEHGAADADKTHAVPPIAPLLADGVYPQTPQAVVDAYAAALRAGDEAAIRRLLANDVIIAEGGGAERSVEEYAGHHMPADMAYTAAVDFTMKKRDSIISADMAAVISESQVHGAFRGETVHARMMETMILRLTDGEWKIVHIHWSSAPIAGAHEH